MKKEILGISILISLLAFSGIALASSGKLFASEDPTTLFIAVGNEYASQGESGKAADAFKKAIEYDKENAAAWHNLGVLYLESGDESAGVKMLMSAIEADQSYARAHYSLGLFYYQHKEYENSITELRKVIELESRNPNAHFDLGVVLIEKFRQKEDSGNVNEGDLADLQAGLAEYQKTVEIDPEFPHASSNAAIVENVLNEYLSIA